MHVRERQALRLQEKRKTEWMSGSLVLFPENVRKGYAGARPTILKGNLGLAILKNKFGVEAHLE